MPTDTSTTMPDTTSSQSPERLQQAASGIMDQAGRTAERQASMTMSRAGEALDQVARAVRESGSQLREQRPEFADVADMAAQRVEGVSTFLREHDAREVLDEAERFARRQPALVIGGGLVLGLLAGRLLRSGAEPQTSMDQANWSGGAGTYRGSNGWSGGSSSDVSSTTIGATAGMSSPGSGYGTGYGASYDTGANGLQDATAENLLATDAAAGTSETSSKKRSRSTGAD